MAKVQTGLTWSTGPKKMGLEMKKFPWKAELAGYQGNLRLM
jgi:hypothetical protein